MASLRTGRGPRKQPGTRDNSGDQARQIDPRQPGCSRATHLGKRSRTQTPSTGHRAIPSSPGDGRGVDAARRECARAIDFVRVIGNGGIGLVRLGTGGQANAIARASRSALRWSPFAGPTSECLRVRCLCRVRAAAPAPAPATARPARSRLTRLYRSRRGRGCVARRPVPQLCSMVGKQARQAGARPHCEDSTLSAGEIPRRAFRSPRRIVQRRHIATLGWVVQFQAGPSGRG